MYLVVFVPPVSLALPCKAVHQASSVLINSTAAGEYSWTKIRPASLCNAIGAKGLHTQIKQVSMLPACRYCRFHAGVEMPFPAINTLDEHPTIGDVIFSGNGKANITVKDDPHIFIRIVAAAVCCAVIPGNSPYTSKLFTHDPVLSLRRQIVDFEVTYESVKDSRGHLLDIKRHLKIRQRNPITLIVNKLQLKVPHPVLRHNHSVTA